MTTKTYTETDIANLISQFNESVDERHPAGAGNRGTRVVEPVSAPQSGYRVSVEGFPHIDVETSSRGLAVVLAQAVARCSPGFAGYGAHLFMWNYTVTTAEGVSVDGMAIREEVQTARMTGK